MFEVTDVIGIIISSISFIVSLFAYHTARESLSLNAFMNALEVWGSNEARKARRYIHENFPNYTSGQDDTGVNVKLRVKIGKYDKPITHEIKVRELSDKDREYFEKIAVLTDRVGFMLFEMKKLPKEFKKAYLEWLHDVFCTIWNRVAPHINRERKKRNFVPYFEKLAYLTYHIGLRQKTTDKIILLDLKKMEEALQEYKKLWKC